MQGRCPAATLLHWTLDSFSDTKTTSCLPVSCLRDENLCLITSLRAVAEWRHLSTFPVSSMAPLLIMELCQRPYYRRNKRRVHAMLRNTVGPGAVSLSLATLGFMCQHVFSSLKSSWVPSLTGAVQTCHEDRFVRLLVSTCGYQPRVSQQWNWEAVGDWGLKRSGLHSRGVAWEGSVSKASLAYSLGVNKSTEHCPASVTLDISTH